MTPDNDPSTISFIFEKLLGWIVAFIVALASLMAKRSFGKADKLEERVLVLEKTSVTHQDLQRIEKKLDDQLQRIWEKMDRNHSDVTSLIIKMGGRNDQ